MGTTQPCGIEKGNYLPRSAAGSPAPVNAATENRGHGEYFSPQALFGVRCLGTALECGDSSPHSKEKLPTEALCHHVGNYETRAFEGCVGFCGLCSKTLLVGRAKKAKCGLLEGKVIGIWRGRVDLENGIGWSETCFDPQPLLHRSRLSPDPITTITWQTLCKHAKRDITNKYVHQKYYYYPS